MADVLVIEDHPVNLELLQALLGAYGHQVRVAADAETGLAAASGQRPDLIVCDIQLPGMDGYAFARACRADPALREVPLLAVTALAMVGDRDKVLAAGFDEHVAKPIDPAAFIQRVSSYLASTEPVRAADLPPGAAGTIPADLLAPRPGLCVLMVDDLFSNRDFKRDLLEPAGYRVEEVGDGESAWRRLQGGGVDLVLSDVVMPDLDGFALLRRMRDSADLRATPFVFLTSTARDSVSMRRGLALGAQAYLIRPLEPLDLLMALRRVLDPDRPG